LAAANAISVVEGPENALALMGPSTPGHKIIRLNGGHHFFSITLGKRPRAWRAWLEKRSFARAEHLCAVSRYVATTTLELLKLGDTPIEILPNPVDTDFFRPMPEIPVVPGLIVFAGTLCEKKGIRQLLQAMPEIIAAVPNAHLAAYGRDSVGPGTGGSYRESLQRELKPVSRDSVKFMAHANHASLPSKLAQAQVLVYPSHMEAQGIVVLEGMAVGRPVVVSKTGPGPEAIEDGVCGLLCDPHDPHAIAEAVIRVLRDRALASRLGAAARERALRDSAVDKLVVKNEEFYCRCLEGCACD
jgi:glycosyltransferase involved in cell wall biosynthesis